MNKNYNTTKRHSQKRAVKLISIPRDQKTCIKQIEKFALNYFVHLLEAFFDFNVRTASNCS